MYKKIDIYIKTNSDKWIYHCSTNQAKTCKQAIANFKSSSRFNSNSLLKELDESGALHVKANFAKE